MEQMMKQFWLDHKGKGKGNKSNKRQKMTKLNPWQRLSLATSKLAINQAKQNRQLHADLTHTATYAQPYPEEFQEAIDTTAATKGTERRQAAKASWMALCQSIAGTKKQLPEKAHSVIKKHAAQPKNLESRVMECRAAVSFDTNSMVFSWWLKGLDDVDEAMQEIAASLAGDIKHGPAPAFGLERERIEALTAVMSTQQTSSQSSTDVSY